MARSKKACYYCGAPAQSRQHVVPRMMMKGFDCDSITVPSCHEHNSNKTNLDQKVVSAFSISLDNGRDRYGLGETRERAIDRARSSFSLVKRSVFSSPLIRDLPDGVTLPEVAYIENQEDLRRWILQIAAGLTYDAAGDRDASIHWDGDDVWIYDPDFEQRSGPMRFEEAMQCTLRWLIDAQLDEELNWVDGWSAAPKPYPKDIFYFQLLFFFRDIDNFPVVIFKLVFYGSYKFYVAFWLSQQTLTCLKGKVASQPDRL